jgi:hypothetical protein
MFTATNVHSQKKSGNNAFITTNDQGVCELPHIPICDKRRNKTLHNCNQNVDDTVPKAVDDTVPNAVDDTLPNAVANTLVSDDTVPNAVANTLVSDDTVPNAVANTLVSSDTVQNAVDNTLVSSDTVQNAVEKPFEVIPMPSIDTQILKYEHVPRGQYEPAIVNEINYNLPFDSMYNASARPGCSWKIRREFWNDYPLLLWTISDDYIAENPKSDDITLFHRKTLFLGDRFRSTRGRKSGILFEKIVVDVDTSGETNYKQLKFHSAVYKITEFNNQGNISEMNVRFIRFILHATIENCEQSLEEFLKVGTLSLESPVLIVNN